MDDAEDLSTELCVARSAAEAEHFVIELDASGIAAVSVPRGDTALPGIVDRGLGHATIRVRASDVERARTIVEALREDLDEAEPDEEEVAEAQEEYERDERRRALAGQGGAFRSPVELTSGPTARPTEPRSLRPGRASAWLIASLALNVALGAFAVKSWAEAGDAPVAGEYPILDGDGRVVFSATYDGLHASPGEWRSFDRSGRTITTTYDDEHDVWANRTVAFGAAGQVGIFSDGDQDGVFDDFTHLDESERVIARWIDEDADGLFDVAYCAGGPAVSLRTCEPAPPDVFAVPP